MTFSRTLFLRSQKISGGLQPPARIQIVSPRSQPSGGYFRLSRRGKILIKLHGQIPIHDRDIHLVIESKRAMIEVRGTGHAPKRYQRP